MVVGVCRISIALHGNRSLKGKRQVIRSVKDKVKKRFNISIAEVDNHDILQTASLGMCVAASDSSHADSQIQKAVNFISAQADVTSISFELINIKE
ncbi:YlxP-like protein [hydrothermal vent metagenome]|uniref:YlxP-like protein n=1 Tax=hydrothermal vent metagenome TaxID=652676 RepID=A0A3B1CIQ8_9ZZZZ